MKKELEEIQKKVDLISRKIVEQAVESDGNKKLLKLGYKMVEELDESGNLVLTVRKI